MTRQILVCTLSLALGTRVWAQGDAVKEPVAGAAAGKVRTPYYLDPAVFRGALLLEAPAGRDSAEGRADLVEVHRVEGARTPEQVAAARYDDEHEDIFVYAGVVGEGFRAEGMPATAALSAHLRNDSGVVNAPLKERFRRVRPYHVDPTLHAVCKTGAVTDYSYPSGHAMVGYLMGLTVARMVPEKAEEILARADGYARDRVVCGVHYPSDVAGSRKVAYAMFGYLLATPRYEKELAAATVETRRRLGLGELAAQ